MGHYTLTSSESNARFSRCLIVNALLTGVVLIFHEDPRGSCVQYEALLNTRSVDPLNCVMTGPWSTQQIVRGLCILYLYIIQVYLFVLLLTALVVVFATPWHLKMAVRLPLLYHLLGLPSVPFGAAERTTTEAAALARLLPERSALRKVSFRTKA